MPLLKMWAIQRMVNACWGPRRGLAQKIALIAC